MKTKRGSEIAVGDTLWIAGKPRPITSIEPYTGPLAYLWNGKARLARSELPEMRPWVITLSPDETYDIIA